MTPAPAPAAAHAAPKLPFASGGIPRVEAFSDAVFAFAVTLLVVSLEVPRTFAELTHAMRGFFAFAISFAMLLWIWHQHTRFFRRFPLDDALTHALNGVLLFVVLFYVYPLKFLWSLLFDVFTGGSLTVTLPGGPAEPVMQPADTPRLFLIYGLGFAGIFLALALLYASAWWRRARLGLDELGIFDAQSGIWENVAVASVGLLSVAIATLGGPRWTMWAGFSYILIGVVKTYHGSQHGKRRSSLARRLVLAKAVAQTSALEDKTRQGIPQPPQRKLDDSK